MKTLDNKINLNAFVNGLKSTKGNFEQLYQEFYDYLKGFKTKEDDVILTIVLPMLNEEKTIKAIL